MPEGLCSPHLWRTSRSKEGGLGGSPELTTFIQEVGCRPPMVPSHLNHPVVLPQGGPCQHLTDVTSSASQSPNRAWHLPHSTSCFQGDQNPLDLMGKTRTEDVSCKKPTWEVPAGLGTQPRNPEHP